MNKFIKWLKNDKSNTILVIVFLVLLNLVCANNYFRIDLTNAKSYSLSENSKTLVSTLEQPLSVNVFFSSNLPSPYNTTEQYLEDLLVEYKNSANDNFNYIFYDMDDSENQDLAASYGLKQLQIGKVGDTEWEQKLVYMGVVFNYGDYIEIVDGLSASDGMEYKITSAMSKIISNTSILAGLSSKVTMTLYISPKLAGILSNFDSIEKSVRDAFLVINAKNNNSITFAQIEPTEEEIKDLVAKYGVSAVNWDDPDGNSNIATVSLVLEYEGTFRLVSLPIVNMAWGDKVVYYVSGLGDLTTSMEDALDALVSKRVDVAYLTGNGEKDIASAHSDAYNFKSISSDWYNFIGIDLETDKIPSKVKTLIINGSSSEISDAELYKIDQFVMKGGNLLVFADPFLQKESYPYGQYGPASYTYEPNSSNISKLLEKYGVSISESYVLDKECYTSSNQETNKLGNQNFYSIPVVKQKNLNQDSVITANIPYVIMMNSAAINSNFSKEEANGRYVETLISSSDKAWQLSKDINLSPSAITVPAEKEMKAENLAVLVSGKFSSAFDSIPAETIQNEAVTDDSVQDENLNTPKISTTALNTQTRLSSSVQKSSIIVCGSSYITTSTIIDEKGETTTAIFIRNALDYLNGNEALCSMRTKSISSNAFTVDITNNDKNKARAKFAKTFNQYVLPLLVLFVGFLVWRLRIRRRAKIQECYYPEGMMDRLGGKKPKFFQISIKKTESDRVGKLSQKEEGENDNE